MNAHWTQVHRVSFYFGGIGNWGTSYIHMSTRKNPTNSNSEVFTPDSAHRSYVFHLGWRICVREITCCFRVFFPLRTEALLNLLHQTLISQKPLTQSSWNFRNMIQINDGNFKLCTKYGVLFSSPRTCELKHTGALNVMQLFQR